MLIDKIKKSRDGCIYYISIAINSSLQLLFLLERIGQGYHCMCVCMEQER